MVERSSSRHYWHSWQPLQALFRFAVSALHHRIILVKLQADTVHAMPLVCGCRISLALEYVSEVSTTVGADDLRARHAEGAIRVSCHSTWNIVEICRPATSTLELVVGFVERRIAASASVDTSIGQVLVVLAGEGGFGALFT